MTDPVEGKPNGRPPILDQEKRKIILALLANGSSRRVAAAYVGCASSTITHTAARDPEFEAALNRAEQNSEVLALRCLHDAAHSGRYWRAAAWMLERKNPDDFAIRQPNLFSEDQVQQLLIQFMLFMIDDLPDEKFNQGMAKLKELIDESRQPSDLVAPSSRPPIVMEASFPSTAEGFATDPTKAVDFSGEAASP